MKTEIIWWIVGSILGAIILGFVIWFIVIKVKSNGPPSPSPPPPPPPSPVITGIPLSEFLAKIGENAVSNNVLLSVDASAENFLVGNQNGINAGIYEITSDQNSASVFVIYTQNFGGSNTIPIATLESTIGAWSSWTIGGSDGVFGVAVFGPLGTSNINIYSSPCNMGLFTDDTTATSSNQPPVMYMTYETLIGDPQLIGPPGIDTNTVFFAPFDGPCSSSVPEIYVLDTGIPSTS